MKIMKVKLIACALTAFFVFAVSSCSYKQKSDSEPTDEEVIAEPDEDMEVLNPEADIPEEGFTIEAVDLGLSVLWANANIGANGIYEKGDYYAWGESATKSSYTLDNYFDYYIEVKDGGYVHRGFKQFNKAGLSLLGTDYDTAHNIMGGNWRMPTSDEYNELITKCELTATNLKNENGNPLKDEEGNIVLSYVEVVGPNGNKIIFPSGGRKEADEYIKREGFYWTANMFNRESDMENAMAACLGSYMRGPMALNKRNKGLGFNIRAVMDRDPSTVKIKEGEYLLEGRTGNTIVKDFEITIQGTKVTGKYSLSSVEITSIIYVEGNIDEKNNISLKKTYREEPFGHMEGVFDGKSFHGTDCYDENEEGHLFKLVVK